MGIQHAFFEASNKVNILIVGDVMIDRYLSGRVDRISPEAPVPVVHLQSRENRLGGAANVALNVGALDATPYLCTVVGEDDNGVLFKNLLPEYKLSSRGLVISRERATTVKTRVLAQSQQLIRVDTEDTFELRTEEEQALLTVVRDLLDQKPIDLILFQDYNKGVLSSKVIGEIILEAVKRDIPTTVDPKFHNFWSFKRVTLFKPNLREIRAQLPFSIEPKLEDLSKASKYIRAQIDNQYTLITLSEHGLFLDDGRECKIYPPTETRAIADVSGAGDTVISVISVGLALGLPLPEIATLANLAGGQVCEQLGVVPVNKAQLEREFAALSPYKREE